MKTVILICLLSLSTCLSKPTDPQEPLQLGNDNPHVEVKTTETAVQATSDNHANVPTATAAKDASATTLISQAPNSIPAQADKKDTKTDTAKATETPETPPKSADTPAIPPKSPDAPASPPKSAETPATPPKSAETPATPSKTSDTPTAPAKAADTPTTPSKSTDTPATPPKSAETPVDNKTADKFEAEQKTDGKDTKETDSKAKPDNQTATTQKTADTTVNPSAAPAADKHEVVQSRSFDGPSFIGGIILTLGLLAIGFMGFKYYKNQTERNYHTL